LREWPSLEDFPISSPVLKYTVNQVSRSSRGRVIAYGCLIRGRKLAVRLWYI
jgi:hypothetical protein